MNTDWIHPEHAKGIKPQKIFDNIVTGLLTDKKSDRYQKAGIYSNRRYYRQELKKLRMERDLFKPVKQNRLVYNMETQEIEEREF